jgi:hypothetical protein
MLAWVELEKIVNEKERPIDVTPDGDYFFLREIYGDERKKIAMRKPSQYGLSTWAILRGIHRAKYRSYNVIHTLPTLGDVSKFVPSKVNEIIKKNPQIAGSQTGAVDAVQQKQFGNGFVFYKGTFTDREALMLTSDANFYDELDKSDMAQIKNYASRQEGQGSMREEAWLSTPTIPGFGIDAMFEKSDQKYWRFKCGHCEKEQNMKWPESVDQTKGVYICRTCHKPLKPEWIRKGKWKAKFPGREISGYALTQLIAPWVSAEQMCQAHDDAVREHMLDYFYNHKLGLPYISSESAIGATLILRNCIGDKPRVEMNSCMGMDVQLHELYIVIGNKEGVYGITTAKDSEEYIISSGKTGKSKWDRWAELMEVYDVRYCVIDGGFTPNEVVKAAGKFPRRVWVNWYKDDPKHARMVRFADDDFIAAQKKTFVEEITILTERDRMFDFLVDDLKQGGTRFFYNPDDPGIKGLIQHTQTTYARTVTDRLGLASREWISTGQDDWLHGLIYFRIARMLQDRAEK